MKEPAARMIVVGGLNTDIVAAGVDALLGPGELSRSGELLIGPGGKSSNIARMAACLLGERQVFMIGKTSRDPYGLWEVPVKALREAGVNTDHVAVEDRERSGKLPGVALIPVNRRGQNQIYCIPGISVGTPGNGLLLASRNTMPSSSSVPWPSSPRASGLCHAGSSPSGAPPR